MNQQSAPTPISPDVAKESHGIFASYERMQNGELRFRLMSETGDGYIRTVATLNSGWQNSHWHKKVKETYIVQNGWMILASLHDGSLIFEKFESGKIVTTEPTIPHTVYLPANAIIHTVKHGDAQEKDWVPYPELDAVTKNLSESAALALSKKPSASVAMNDPRFAPYVEIYNNLDNLIWQLPAFFSSAIGLFVGFVGSTLSQANNLSPLIWMSLFIFIGLFSFIGAYSMFRIRLHHTRMGKELRNMESQGYFHEREKVINKHFPPSAPSLFISFFIAVSVIFTTVGILAAFEYPPLLDTLKSRP